MRRTHQRLSYLNAILTVNAVMLAALVWTNIAGAPMATVAYAAPQSTGSSQPQGVPDAGLQQLQIINEIKSVRNDLQHLSNSFLGGKIRVNVGNLSEIKLSDIKLDIDYSKLRDALKQP